MGTHTTKPLPAILRVGAALVALLAAAGAHAEFLRVTAANSAGNSLYDVTAFSPPPGASTALNTDGASHGSFRALVHVENLQAGTVDVLAADATLGQIVRYTPAVGATPAAEAVVWSYATAGIGPAHPDGLSVDAAGNLYMVTSKLNDSSTSQVWVLPANAASASGYAASPLLIDGTFATANGVKLLLETAVAATTTAAWSPGDLLVLVGNGSNSNSQKNTNDADVLVYRAASIGAVLSGAGPRTGPDAIMLAPGQFPAGEYPTGMDFWPADSLLAHPTLLLATTAGRILRYDFTASSSGAVPSLVQVFASGLGGGLKKLKTGLQLGVPYAFVSQTLSGGTGQILKFGAPPSSGGNNLIGAATQGVTTPDGLAVTRLDAIAAASCAAATGCNPSGALPHQITVAGARSPTGNVVEDTCVVAADPRVSGGVCDGTTLNVATLCPGFGNEIIPGTMCGASGASGSGFALIRSVAGGVDGIPGLLVYSQESPDQILPPALGLTNPSCPAGVLAWAPRSDASPSEGSIVEVDPVTGLMQLVEMTGFCDASGSGTRGMSVYGVGLTLNTAALSGGLAGYAQAKYDHLYATADTANIATTTRQTLETALGVVNTYLSQGDYACAANQVVKVDTLVGQDPNPAADYPGNAANPNPWGEIRGRLANLYLTINTRILGHAANAQWPLVAPDAPPACPAPVVSFTASPSSIAPNAAATLTWSSQHASACTASGGWSGSEPLSGTQSTGALAATASYSLACTGAGGSTTATATVTVVPPPQIQSFGASPSKITVGGSTTLSWSATATSCAISGGSSTYRGLAASGSLTISSIMASTTYALGCANSLGATATATTLVTVAAKQDDD